MYQIPDDTQKSRKVTEHQGRCLTYFQPKNMRLFDAVLALITLLAVAVDRRKPLQDAASQTGTSPKGFVDVTRPQDAAIVLKVSQ